MTREDHIMGYVGLAVRARQITFGEEAVLMSVRAGKAALVLLDASASLNARKKLEDACGYRNVRLYLLPPGLIGRAAGKSGRMAACMPPGGLEKALAPWLTQSCADAQTINEQTTSQMCGGASVT